jgi:hypothetical protein
MSEVIDGLVAAAAAQDVEIAALNTKVDAAVALLDGLSERLAQAISSGDLAKVKQVLDSLNVDLQELKAAKETLEAGTVRNTPAE